MSGGSLSWGLRADAVWVWAAVVWVLGGCGGGFEGHPTLTAIAAAARSQHHKPPPLTPHPLPLAHCSAGKSTLLRMVMGREKPNAGRVELGEHSIHPNYFEQNQAEALDLNKTGQAPAVQPPLLPLFVDCKPLHS